MTYAIMLGVFVVLLFLGAPIALSLGMSSLLAILYNGTGINVIAGQIYGGIGKYLLLAVPFFVLSGNIMAKAGISDRLIAFIDALLGHLRGGIAMVCIVVACFFGAISGSGAATVAALGVILIPAMIEREKFSDPFAHGVVAAASSIAVIIPPSISFVIYASLTGVSVGDIFVAGILPRGADLCAQAPPEARPPVEGLARGVAHVQERLLGSADARHYPRRHLRRLLLRHRGGGRGRGIRPVCRHRCL